MSKKTLSILYKLVICPFSIFTKMLNIEYLHVTINPNTKTYWTKCKRHNNKF